MKRVILANTKLDSLPEYYTNLISETVRPSRKAEEVTDYAKSHPMSKGGFYVFCRMVSEWGPIDKGRTSFTPKQALEGITHWWEMEKDYFNSKGKVLHGVGYGMRPPTRLARILIDFLADKGYACTLETDIYHGGYYIEGERVEEAEGEIDSRLLDEIITRGIEYVNDRDYSRQYDTREKFSSQVFKYLITNADKLEQYYSDELNGVSLKPLFMKHRQYILEQASQGHFSS